MPCAHPLPARRDPNGGVRLLPRQDATKPLFYQDGELLALPCGSCLGCKMSRAREWSFRCQLEFNDHDETCWTTLTYDDAHLPPTLQKSHLSGFLKRLRSRLDPLRVRFFASGEYGEKNGRPHYHAILYGMSDRPEIQESWPHGHVKTFPLSAALIAYTAGYCVKKVGHSELREERLDRSTGELYNYQPPFVLMSRRPGIGGSARQYSASWRKTAIYSNAPMPVPRFLHQSWLENASPSQILTLTQEKLSESKLRDTSRERLQAQEKINAANLKLKSENRPL